MRIMMTRNAMVLLRHFSVVFVILCSLGNLADGMENTSTTYRQPFVVDIRMPGVHTYKVCLSVASHSNMPI